MRPYKIRNNARSEDVKEGIEQNSEREGRRNECAAKDEEIQEKRRDEAVHDMRTKRERDESRGADRAKSTYTTLEWMEGGVERHDACGARHDAMTYRPCSPRALTSRSRPESDWEHVNSTPAITRPRADRVAPIGRPPASPSPRLAAPARAA